MEAFNSNLLESFSGICKGELESSCRLIPPSFERRRGISSVTLVKEEGAVILHEKGKWLCVHSHEEIAYTNILRFRQLKEKGRVALEHLRFGKNRPVLLVELIQISSFAYRSLAPHICNEDTYVGSLLFEEHFIQLDWKMTGPKKNTILRALYTD